MIHCPRCKSKQVSEYKKSNTDNIDKLSHSHMICKECDYQFNHWNESEIKLKSVFGKDYTKYCVDVK